MKPDLNEIIYNDFMNLIEDSPMDLDVHQLYRDGCITSEIRDVVNGDKDPVILLAFSYEYVTDGSVSNYKLIDSTEKISIKEIDVEKEYPLKASMDIYICTRDMSKNQILEDYFVGKYKNERIVRVPYPYDNNMFYEIVIKIDSNMKIDRTKGVRLLSFMSIECKGCILYEATYSPVEVAFDEVNQDEVLRRLVAFYDMSKYFNELSLEDKTIGEDIDDYRKKSERMSQLADDLRKKTEIISDDYADQFYINEIFNVYEKDNNRNLKEAIRQVERRKDLIDIDKENYYQELALKQKKKDENEKARIEKENEKIRAEEFNKLKFQSHGDTMTNLFTDAVISDIKSRFNYEISIYGGSTYMDYFKCKKETTLNYPVILVKTNESYADILNTYYITRQDGSNEIRWYDFVSSIPFGYGVTLCINYNKNTKEYAKQIYDYLISIYSVPIIIYANNPMEAGTYLPITLRVDSSKIQNGTESNSDNAMNKMINSLVTEGSYKIQFIQNCSVYFSNISNDEIQYNPWGQIALLKQLIYARNVSKQLSNILSKDLPNGYKTLITGQEPTYEFKVDRAYRELSERFKNRYPIDRQLFNEAFKSIIGLYPSFYDKVMAGWVYNQIEQDIKYFRDSLKNHCNSIYQKLDIQQKHISDFILGKDPIDYRSDEAIQYYIDKMSSKNLDISEAIKEFEKHEKEKQKKMEEDRIRLEKEREEMAYYQSQYGGQYDDQYYDRGSSSGGSFIKSALSVAAGNILANNYEKKKEKKKQFDYRGTSSCQIGKPNTKSVSRDARHINCIGCPIRMECASYE